MVSGPMGVSDPIPNLLATLLPGQKQVLASLKTLQSFRDRYNAMLVPILHLKRDNISRSERLLLEPLTLQLRTWGVLEDLLLGNLSKWIQAGSLETAVHVPTHDVRGRPSLNYLRGRYQAVAHGCSLAISDLQRTVLSLEHIRNEARQKQPSTIEDNMAGSAVARADQSVSSDANNHTAHSEGWSWMVEMVKHDLGDLVSQLETSHGESPDVRRRRQADAPLETVLITDEGREGTTRTSPDTPPLTLMDAHGNRYVQSRPANPALASEDGRLIRDLCLLLVTGLLLGHIAKELLGLPALVGHLLAGLLLGFSCLDQISSLVSAQSLGQLSLLLLIYQLGVTSRGAEGGQRRDEGGQRATMMMMSHTASDSPLIRRILSSTLAAFGLGTLLVGMLLGACVGLMLALGSILFAVPPLQAALSGLILSFSSTILAVRLLGDLGGPVGGGGDLFMVILLVQDGLFCLSLSLLPLLAGAPRGGVGTSGIIRGIISCLAADLSKIVLLLISLSLLRWGWSRRRFPFSPPAASGKFMLASLVAWSAHTLTGLNLEMALFISSIQLNDNSRWQRESHDGDHGDVGHDSNNSDAADADADADVGDDDGSHKNHGQARVRPRSLPSHRSGELASLFFFASIGLLLDVRFLVRELALLLVLTTSVMIVKFGLFTLLLSATSAMQTCLLTPTAAVPRPPSPFPPLRMALAMCQVSELALMLGLRARHLHLLSPECYYLLAGITLLSLVISPVLVKGLRKRAKSYPEYVTRI